MQKVDGSSPFDRFVAKALEAGPFLSLGRGSERVTRAACVERRDRVYLQFEHGPGSRRRIIFMEVPDVWSHDLGAARRTLNPPST